MLPFEESKAVIFFYRLRCKRNLLNSVKSFTSEILLLTLQKLHLYIITNYSHTSFKSYNSTYLIKTLHIYIHITIHNSYTLFRKRNYMHTLMDDLYTQRLLIFCFVLRQQLIFLLYHITNYCVKL